MKKYQKVLKPIFFCVGLLLIVAVVQKPFGVDDYRIYQSARGLYKEPKNSLDAIYIGASNVYAYFQAPLAFDDYGYAIYPYSIPSMPARSVKYIIEESRKTQPDALYIINLNDFKDTDFPSDYIHRLSDYMPFSMTKVKMINDLTNANDIHGLSKLEYYFPLIRFHSGWSELNTGSFARFVNGMKSAQSYDNFLKTSEDVSQFYQTTDQRINLNNEQEELLDDLLNYCEQEQVKVLFVFVPQSIKQESVRAQFNTITDEVEARGFDILNLQSSISEIG